MKLQNYELLIININLFYIANTKRLRIFAKNICYKNKLNKKRTYLSLLELYIYIMEKDLDTLEQEVLNKSVVVNKRPFAKKSSQLYK